jgi:hypothetical protein
MKYLYKFLFLICPFLIANNSYSQVEPSYPSATINSEFCVGISMDSPLSEFYTIDISGLSFESELDAVNKFGFICNNLITYVVNYSENKVILHLHLDRTYEPMNLEWWGDYLDSRCDS